MNQGNFLTQNEFVIFDHNQKRKYKGNIFVFQYCVVCTERISTTKLQFKAYFPCGTSHTECINEKKYLLYEQNNYKIEISSEANVMQQMMKQIRLALSSNRENLRHSILSNDIYIKHIDRKALVLPSTKDFDLLSDRETSIATSADNRNSSSSGESEYKKVAYSCRWNLNKYFVCVLGIIKFRCRLRLVRRISIGRM